jgi:prepilin-type processing-associated H-X9-DG protein
MVSSGDPPNSTRPNTRAAAGFHAGGLLVSYVDGHVGFVSNDIDMATYQALGSRNGGEVIANTP